jgi:NitT/TauT family transport system substrate-binding protein
MSGRSPTGGIIAVVILVIAALSLLHFHPWQHADTTAGGLSPVPMNHTGPNTGAAQSLTVGYLPVTCHLTCPVTDFASHTSTTNTNFNSLKFLDFPTVVAALKSKQIQATFMVVPLAMKLRQDGVPVKICYLGHRDGSEIVVAKDSTAKSLRDLRGTTMALPTPYSNQNLVIHALMQQQGLKPDDIKFVYMGPPQMPTALENKSISGYFVGEPFCGAAELSGVGRVLYYARDVWPNFISCALVVHEDLIKNNPSVVRDLVRGIAESGLWADTHRAEAAKILAKYNNQKEKLLNYVLTSDPPRVRYDDLTPTDADLQKIEDMALAQGILTKKVPMSELIDREFIPADIQPANIDMSTLQVAVK